ncbi:MAG: gamma-glutamyltransferase [Deltaproteobacteria bacterium]|nr:gamma-glutamyltransferase [Deltaproteobacteria bacterium]MDQ3296218.1 gamma-glutamyltransferase [Myxococcota bacterium]
MSSVARLALLATVLLACSRKPPPPPPPATGDAALAQPTITPPAPSDAARGPVYRDPATSHVVPAIINTGKTFMVVSEGPLSSKIGKDVLASGGNAVDAAVAVAFALAVEWPSAGNLGGGGFAVVRTAPGKAVALDFREVAPGAATETMFLDDKGNPTDASLTGHLASGVPGSVAGLHALHVKLGKQKWADLIAPAIALARDGFTIDARTVRDLAQPHTSKRMLLSPASAALWYRDGKPVPAGTLIKIPELAATLERIAANGPDGFYKGPTAEAIAAEMKRGGGLITTADLAAYKPVWREPLRVGYRGHTITAMPPPSSGGIVLAMTAGMLRDVDVAKLGWHSHAHVHQLAEVWKRAFAARNQLLGDPKFVKDMPVSKLLSPALHASLAKSITDKATSAKEAGALLEGSHTTNFCVIDANGMAVAITTTLNTSYGSGVTVAGFLLNNEMDDFTAKPGAPNTFGLIQGTANKIEPGKRMLSSMSPSIVEGPKGELVMVAGAAGGPRIITAVWQTISNVLDFGQPASEAVANRRVHHQNLPDLVRIEAGSIDQATEQALKAAGHTVDWSWVDREFGTANAIVRSKAGWDGAADPRGGGAALGD